MCGWPNWDLNPGRFGDGTLSYISWVGAQSLYRVGMNMSWWNTLPINQGKQEIEREFKDKQPLPVTPPSHMQGLLLLFNAASTELPAWPDRHTITQSEWELRLTADTLPTEQVDHRLIREAADREEILNWMLLDPSKDTLLLTPSLSCLATSVHRCTHAHAQTRPNWAHEMGSAGNNWPHWWCGAMGSIGKAAWEKEGVW